MNRLTDRAKKATEIIESIDCIHTLDRSIEQLKDALSLSHIAYHATCLSNLTSDGPFIVTTYHDSWVRRYVEQNYQNLDPVVLASLRGFLPVDWRLLDFSTKQRVAFMDEAAGFGISAKGMTVPIRGPAGEHALFSVNAAVEEKTWDLYVSETRSDLMLIAHLLHNRIRHIGCDISAIEPVSLSPRELDVLHWLARGKTFEDVADILQISPRTVRAHSESARYKLNASNSVNAVAKALSLGLIAPLSTR